MNGDDDDTRTSYLASEADGSLPAGERAGWNVGALLASPLGGRSRRRASREPPRLDTGRRGGSEPA